jgi:hypothetical protein
MLLGPPANLKRAENEDDLDKAVNWKTLYERTRSWYVSPLSLQIVVIDRTAIVARWAGLAVGIGIKNPPFIWLPVIAGQVSVILSGRRWLLLHCSFLLSLFYYIPSAKVPPTKYWLVNRRGSCTDEQVERSQQVLVVLVGLTIDVQILDYWVLEVCIECADKSIL